MARASWWGSSAKETSSTGPRSARNVGGSRWLALLTDEHAAAADYIKSHAIKLADVMTHKVVTATPDTPLQDVAMMMEANGVKRIPIVRDGKLVGLVSRANLVQAVAAAGTKLEIPVSDSVIREKLMSRLREESWANSSLLNATVHDGVVTLWGLAASPTERQAIRVAGRDDTGRDCRQGSYRYRTGYLDLRSSGISRAAHAIPCVAEPRVFATPPAQPRPVGRPSWAADHHAARHRSPGSPTP